MQVNLGFVHGDAQGEFDANGEWWTNAELEAYQLGQRDANPPSTRFNLADYLPKSNNTTTIIGGLLAILVVVELLSKRKR